MRGPREGGSAGAASRWSPAGSTSRPSAFCPAQPEWGLPARPSSALQMGPPFKFKPSWAPPVAQRRRGARGGGPSATELEASKEHPTWARQTTDRKTETHTVSQRQRQVEEAASSGLQKCMSCSRRDGPQPQLLAGGHWTGLPEFPLWCNGMAGLRSARPQV